MLPAAHRSNVLRETITRASRRLPSARLARAQLPPGLPALEPTEQTAVLVRVYRSRDGDAPSLAARWSRASITTMHPANPRTVAAVGGPRPRGDLEAVARWVVEVSRFQRGGTR
ncbi:hypothetical protein [Streptomyces albipurpureus]|uniref:Uncharacterized protein n=1 Tax=Streptomyces albipurpureus TaxID=2897419 RepID=A0ABT0UJ61_9ACTN|nr:hypothetical protein [Streptomyces sp. CWNU-1]MCM2387458.1 hypothetical protein [Streptomyces sp. CWNU-1]